jgi:hypothetical protein
LKKLLFPIPAMVLALFMPLAATSQIAPDRPPRAAQSETSNKYEVYAGWGYTSINQVNDSRHGLQGVNVAVTRNWGRFFGLTADGAYYMSPIAKDNSTDPGRSDNPGDPSVDVVLFGPVLHVNLTKHMSGFVRGLLGGEHTGGESMTPKLSFAGGAGVGMDYNLTKHFALRASGDNILSSFSVRGNSSELGYSSHRRGNGRATIGLVYKF